MYPKEDGKNGTNRRTKHHDGHDRPNVLGHKGNCTFSNMSTTQNEVNQAGIMIFLRKVLLAKKDGKSGNQWRNNTSLSINS